MIKILDSANATLAILDNVPSAEISEEINGAFTFNFSAVIDGTKSAEIYHGNKAEIEDNYFNIMKTVKKRSESSLIISAACEHVSYDFINVVYTAGVTLTGLASATLTTLISAVNTAITSSFTLGSVTTTASVTISINESITARSVLLTLAAAYGGELSFSKYEISLLSRRGADRGVQFRYRKNISDAAVTVDYQALQDDGSPTVTYEVSAAELEYEQSYIDKGYSDLEHYELGDTIRVIDDDLDINTSARIVKNTYNPLQRMKGAVEIGHYVNDLTDTLTKIKTTTVGKDAVYNGTSIGPDNGFVAERSDALVKTEANATNGITIYLRQTTTASYTEIFYVAVDTATSTAKLYLSGDAVFGGTLSAADGTFTGTLSSVDGTFTGTLSAADGTFTGTVQAGTINSSTINGGTITIGTGDDVFKANSNGMYLGDSTFADAPFRVSLDGEVVATDLNMEGGDITGANITITSNATIGRVLYLSDTSFASAIKWGTATATAEIYIDPASGAMFIEADGNIYSNNEIIATQDWVSANITGVSGYFSTSASHTVYLTNGLITNVV
jgi:hypothetical protein